MSSAPVIYLEDYRARRVGVERPRAAANRSPGTADTGTYRPEVTHLVGASTTFRSPPGRTLAKTRRRRRPRPARVPSCRGFAPGDPMVRRRRDRDRAGVRLTRRGRLAVTVVTVAATLALSMLGGPVLSLVLVGTVLCGLAVVVD